MSLTNNSYIIIIYCRSVSIILICIKLIFFLKFKATTCDQIILNQCDAVHIPQQQHQLTMNKLPESHQFTTSNAMIIQMPQLGICPPTMNQVKYIFKVKMF